MLKYISNVLCWVLSFIWFPRISLPSLRQDKGICTKMWKICLIRSWGCSSTRRIHSLGSLRRLGRRWTVKHEFLNSLSLLPFTPPVIWSASLFLGYGEPLLSLECGMEHKVGGFLMLLHLAPNTRDRLWKWPLCSDMARVDCNLLQ